MRYQGRFEGECVVDSSKVKRSQIAVRSMNFGQHWRTAGITDHRYLATIPRDFYRQLLVEELPEYVDDCKKHPDETCEFENALRKGSWPNAEQIIEDGPLANMSLDYFAHDLLLRWFSHCDPNANEGYVLNTVEAVDFHDGHPRIAGSARDAGISVQYQDV